MEQMVQCVVGGGRVCEIAQRAVVLEGAVQQALLDLRYAVRQLVRGDRDRAFVGLDRAMEALEAACMESI